MRLVWSAVTHVPAPTTDALTTQLGSPMSDYIGNTNDDADADADVDARLKTQEEEEG